MKNWRRNLRTRLSFLTMVSKKFVLLLRKGVYHYECINDWETFIETILLEKEEFYSKLNMEDITDAD